MEPVDAPLASVMRFNQGMSLHSTFLAACAEAHWPGPGSRAVLAVVFELRGWLPWLAEAHAILDAGQAERASRQRRETNRQELTVAYALHRLVLGKTLGVPAADVALLRDDQGCPHVDGGAVFTSLSHAAGCAAVAVARIGPVGIDLEPAVRAGELGEIAHMVGSASETQRVGSLPATEQAREWLATWVRKEAYLKAEGVGLAREMASFCAAEGAVVPSRERPGHGIHVGTLDAGPDWVLGIARPPGSTVRLSRILPP